MSRQTKAQSKRGFTYLPVQHVFSHTTMCLMCLRHFVSAQIHLRQFHGTRYSAISPDMMSSEELEVRQSPRYADDDDQ